MELLFWDASALAKRYFNEVGSDTVNGLFNAAAWYGTATTPWGYTETYAVLLRRLNSRTIDLPTFTTAVAALQTEVVNGPDFILLPFEETDIFESIYYIREHNLNATDAAILTMLLNIVRAYPDISVVMTAADQRLLRAAQAEGLETLNPETVRPEEVPDLLNTLFPQ